MAKQSSTTTLIKTPSGRVYAAASDDAKPRRALDSLGPTIARALDFPGRVADALEVARRLEETLDAVALDLARAECEATTARRLGRDFNAKRAAIAADALREEVVDAEAMLVEIEAITRRLHRERRLLAQRLEAFAAELAALPPGRERAELAALVAEASACLVIPTSVDEAPERAAAAAALYAFTRGETKQTGQAR